MFGSQQGAFSTHLHVSEKLLVEVPAGWSFKDAACLYVAAPTAYSAVSIKANLKAGEWVMTHAAAEGVGLVAVQVAKAMGATVIATVGSERKAQVCLDYRADYVIDYTKSDWQASVLGLCRNNRQGNGTAGVDVVFDPVVCLSGIAFTFLSGWMGYSLVRARH